MGPDHTYHFTVGAHEISRVRADVLADDGWWMIALTSPIYFG
jgi:hypothetical protein